MTVSEDEIARSQGARGAYRWFEPRGPSYVVLALAVANLIYRVLISRPGYFWQDDYYITAWAKYNPLGPDYLLLPFSDHFQPLGFALAWFSQRLFPGSYTAGMLWTALLYAASLWVMYRLLIALFGWRPQIMLVLVFWGFSIFTVQSYLWYAASLYLAPYLLLLPLALLCAAHYLAKPSGPWLLAVLGSSVLVVTAHTFGLALPALTALLIAVGAWGASSLPWWRRIVSQWRLLGAQAIPGLMVVAYYLNRASEGRDVTLEPLQGLLFIGRQLAWVVIPGLAGGPWKYNGYLSPEFPLVTPLGGFIAIEFVVAVALLAWIRPRAFWLWMGSLLLIGGQLFSVTLGRGGGDTAIVIRYSSAGLVALTLAISFTIMSDRGNVFRWRGWGERVAQIWQGWGPTGQIIAVVALIQVYIVSFSISLFTPVLETPLAFNRTYMERLIASAQKVPPDVRLIPQFVPSRVVGVNAPGPTSTELVLANQAVVPGFVNSVAGTLWGFTEQGDLVKQSVWGVEARRPFGKECVAELRSSPVTLDLKSRAEYFYATLSIGSIAERDVELRVELLNDGAVDGVANFVIAPGLQRTFAPLPGAGDQVRLTVVGNDAVCVTDVIVGERFHWDEGWVQDGSSLPTQSFDLSAS
jgi:hypothetical protein